jgi:hypothetical protein
MSTPVIGRIISKGRSVIKKLLIVVGVVAVLVVAAPASSSFAAVNHPNCGGVICW